MSKEKGNLTILLIIALVVIILVGITSFSKMVGWNLSLPELQKTVKTNPSITPNPNAQLSTPTPVKDDTIKFDVEKAKVGDKIGNMSITELRGYKTDKAIGHNAVVSFSGRVTITGEIKYSLPASYGGETVCMENLNSSSQAKMPKLTSQYYIYVYFCFNNRDLAKKLLVKDTTKESQGNATVTIDNYVINWFPIETYNTADLVSISK